uniref:Uncharacterized protein n=1 Tax=Arundo donax TaxID=35708 RepID=A0A0A9EBF1_ARUDO
MRLGFRGGGGVALDGGRMLTREGNWIPNAGARREDRRNAERGRTGARITWDPTVRQTMEVKRMMGIGPGGGAEHGVDDGRRRGERWVRRRRWRERRARGESRARAAAG